MICKLYNSLLPGEIWFVTTGASESRDLAERGGCDRADALPLSGSTTGRAMRVRRPQDCFPHACGPGWRASLVLQPVPRSRGQRTSLPALLLWAVQPGLARALPRQWQAKVAVAPQQGRPRWVGGSRDERSAPGCVPLPLACHQLASPGSSHARERGTHSSSTPHAF